MLLELELLFELEFDEELLLELELLLLLELLLEFELLLLLELDEELLFELDEALLLEFELPSELALELLFEFESSLEFELELLFARPRFDQFFRTGSSSTWTNIERNSIVGMRVSAMDFPRRSRLAAGPCAGRADAWATRDVVVTSAAVAIVMNRFMKISAGCLDGLTAAHPTFIAGSEQVHNLTEDRPKLGFRP